MSRGLGVLERAVAARIADCKRRDPERDAIYATLGHEPPPAPVHVSAWDVCKSIDSEATPTEVQLKAARRAMRTFVRKFPEYAVFSGKGRGRVELYERGDQLSAMWAKLSSRAARHVTLDDARRALEHTAAGRNEPFQLKHKRPIAYFHNKDGSWTPTHLKAPSIFKDLDLE
jgi:hypothetical protein